MASTSELKCEASAKKEKEIEAIKKNLEDSNSKILYLENNWIPKDKTIFAKIKISMVKVN